MTALIAFLGFLGGCALIGFVVFLVVLLRMLRDLRQSVDALCVLMQTRSIKAISDATIEIARQMPSMVQQIAAAAQAFTVFSSFAFNKPGAAPPTVTPAVPQQYASWTGIAPVPGAVATEAPLSPDGSGVVGYDEEEMAKRELQAELRKQGIETEESMVATPAPEKFVGEASSPFTA